MSLEKIVAISNKYGANPEFVEVMGNIKFDIKRDDKKVSNDI